LEGFIARVFCHDREAHAQAADKLKEIVEKERQKAEEEKAKQEREERRKRVLEEGGDGKEKPAVVGVGAKSGVSYCTPRKVNRKPYTHNRACAHTHIQT
jgi:uncharacterized Rossmann fold enzyme